jgi:hypothetical protein
MSKRRVPGDPSAFRNAALIVLGMVETRRESPSHGYGQMYAARRDEAGHRVEFGDTHSVNRVTPTL